MSTPLIIGGKKWSVKHERWSRNYIALIENGKKPFTEKMREKLSTVNNVSANSVPDLASSTECQSCADLAARIAELQKERDYLRRQVEALIGKLPDAKPMSVVGRACGAPDAGRESKRGA